MDYAKFTDSQNTLYVLFGVNCELARWIRKGLDNPDSVPSKALRVAEKYAKEDGKDPLWDELLKAIGGTNGHDLQASERFMYRHWHAHHEAGPYPCPYLLAELQSLGVFPRGYRDHVAHQLKVYLLGLYFYDKCPPIERAITAQIAEELGGKEDSQNNEEEFFLRWMMAALAHDVGYSVEDPGSHESFLQAMTNLLEHPFQGQYGSLADNNTAITHQEIGEAIGLPPCKLGSVVALEDLVPQSRVLAGQLEVSIGDPSRAWAILEPCAKAAQLGKGLASPLETYYRFTEAHPRDGYAHNARDHGVVAALMLLKVWYRYWDAHEKALERVNAQPTYELPNLFKDIPDIRKRLDARRVHAAASAISLHYASPSRYTRLLEDWRANKLAESFHISLDSHPLVFLLRITDILQNWDRPRFWPLREGESVLEDKDLSLHAAGNRILVLFRGDHLNDAVKLQKRPMGLNYQYGRALVELKECLKEEDVDRLVDYDVVLGKGRKPDWDKMRENAREFWEVDKEGYRVVRELPQFDPGWQHLPAGEIDKTNARIRSLMPRGGGTADVELGCCYANAEDRDCGIRRQSLAGLADYGRMGREWYELSTLVQALSWVEYGAQELAYHLDDVEDPEVVKCALVTYKGTWTIRKLFGTEVRDNRFYPNDKNKKGPKKGVAWRLSEFLKSRLRGRAADVDIPVFVGAVERVDDGLLGLVGQPQQQDPDVEKLRERVQKLGVSLGILAENVTKVHDALYLLARQDRSQDIHAKLHNSYQADEAQKFDGYLRERLRSLPHNAKDGYPIWKTRKKDYTGGVA